MLAVFLLAFAAIDVPGQAKAPKRVFLVDFVKAKPGHYDDYLQSLEKNWLAARNIAKRKGFIRSYRILTSPKESNAKYDFLLITEFSDRQSYDAREMNFQTVLKVLGGPVLIKGLRPRELGDIVDSENMTQVSYR